MGIKIRYSAPAAAGSAFAYSVERRADKAFFDFELNIFRLLEDIPAHALISPMIYHDEMALADFAHIDDSEEYTARIYRVDVGVLLIAELPIAACGGDYYASPSKGEPVMEPSYRSGKKFLAGKMIEAKHRYTFYGNDGFTVHTATLWADGTASCNCPRWCRKLPGEARGCIHSARALTLDGNVDETGEQPEPPPPPSPGVQRVTNPFQRRSRPVDT